MHQDSVRNKPLDGNSFGIDDMVEVTDEDSGIGSRMEESDVVVKDWI